MYVQNFRAIFFFFNQLYNIIQVIEQIIPALYFNSRRTKIFSRSSDSSDGGRRSWSSTSNLAKDESSSGYQSTRTDSWSSAMDISSMSLSDLRNVEPETITTVTMKPPRPKTYAGSTSDSYNYRRYSVDENVIDRHSAYNNVTTKTPQHKLQIKNVIDKSNGTSTDNDAEFIIQVFIFSYDFFFFQVDVIDNVDVVYCCESIIVKVATYLF